MPSPVGHALGGIVAGWSAAPRHNVRTAILLAVAAVAPDLDLLIGNHRGISHSVGAAAVAGAVAWIFTRPASAAMPLRRDRLWFALSVALAWWSHAFLDWLSNDTRPPLGVMALWPFTSEYYKSGVEIFPPVSRRYWEPRFWIYNLRALVFELIVLGPPALVCVIVNRYRNRARSSVPDDPPPPSGGAGDTAGTSGRRSPRAARSGSRGRRRAR
jgi:inner membrane protein